MKKINAKIEINNEEKKKIEYKILGLTEHGESSDGINAHIALKYFDKNFECFSEWTKDELSCFSNFIDKMNNLTWREIKKHPGLKYTDIDNANKIPNNYIKEKLSRDITFCELRVGEKARVVGFRRNAVFFLCWLDRNHRICPK